MIATTIEQSKELVRLGLDPATSDMWWIDDQLVAKSDKFDFPSNDEETTVHCAWSLSALLEVMPITITKDGMEYRLKVFPSGLFSTHSDTSKWTLQYCGRDYSYRPRDKYPILVIVTQHNIIDAAYEMACYLLRNNLIEKGCQDE